MSKHRAVNLYTYDSSSASRRTVIHLLVAIFHFSFAYPSTCDNSLQASTHRSRQAGMEGLLLGVLAALCYVGPPISHLLARREGQ